MSTTREHADRQERADERDAPPPDSQDANGHERGHRRTRHTRQLAEWGSLGVSLTVLIGAAGFLVYEGLRARDDALPIVATVQVDQASLRAGRHVVPIEIKNQGPQTARDVKIKIAHRSRDGQWQEQDFVIDYLAEYSSQTIYVYLHRPPREAELFAEPQQYRLE